MVYHEYFNRPFIGWVLRSMKAIPISPSGGPKMILQAFREAGKALDEGDIVCIFPEGQLTRTGLMAPFQRGLQRIVKGRTTPIIPVHLDRLNQQCLQPGQPQAAARASPLPHDDLVRHAPAARRVALRHAAVDSPARPGSLGFSQGRPAVRCIMASSARREGTRCGSRSSTCRRRNFRS